jgi:putative tributyrin esterase
MAFMECHFHSDVLGVESTMNVILPQTSNTQIGMESAVKDGAFPCLYLLHGLSDDHTTWMRRTSIERYVSSLGLAVVMPAVNRSFYTNMVCGPRYWDFVSEELPAVVQSMFRVSGERKDTFVAGLSMGGYGAFKMGLARPDLFAAAGSFSGALDMVWRATVDEDGGFGEERRLVFGEADQFAGSDHDLLALAGKAAGGDQPMPFMYQWCGTEDFLYEDNVRFAEHARSVGLDIMVEEGPGDHQWKYWDQQIVRFLDLLVEKGLLACPSA